MQVVTERNCPMNRNLVDVREKIFDAIPDWDIAERLDEETAGTIRSYIYASPECQSNYWKEFAKIMDMILGDPNDGTEWKKEVQRIFSGVEDA